MNNFALFQKVIYRGRLAFVTNASIARGKYYQIELIKTGKRLLVLYFELIPLTKAKLKQVDRLVEQTELARMQGLPRGSLAARLLDLQKELLKDKKKSKK